VGLVVAFFVLLPIIVIVLLPLFFMAVVAAWRVDPLLGVAARVGPVAVLPAVGWSATAWYGRPCAIDGTLADRCTDRRRLGSPAG
jgi:hypothetical protein